MKYTKPLNLINRTQYSKKQKSIKKIVLMMLPIAVTMVVLLLIKLLPAAVIDRYYSNGLYNILIFIPSAISSIFPFSLGEVLLVASALAVIFGAIAFVVILFKSKNKKITTLKFISLCWVLSTFVLMCFTVFCAPNYYRLTFSEQSDLNIVPSSVNELYTLCQYLLEETNIAIQDTANVEINSLNMFENSLTAFNSVSEEYPFLGKARHLAKPIFLSELLSVANLTGFYFPYTGEANINIHMPITEQPFTICHELAHTKGFMREDEANFIAFLSCRNSSDPIVKYSGYYNALAYSMNALYGANKELYFSLRENYSQALNEDYIAINQYWQPYFNTPAASVSTSVNNAYLKANNLDDGVKSYGRMVDLLLALYKKEKNF